MQAVRLSPTDHNVKSESMELSSLSVSVVLYNHTSRELEPLLESIRESDIEITLYLVDNSPTDALANHFSGLKNVEYFFNSKNLGYGSAHNIAIRKSIENGTKYHLVLNPDVTFKKDVLKRIYQFMEENEEIGLVMPKVLYMDGSIQYLCKLLPTPMDLLGRRFLPAFMKKLFRSGMEKYEFRHRDYNQQMDVPNLSGCFMFMRTKALVKAGLFDERFFMYLEDVDLCRRINAEYRTVYFPLVSIFHGYAKGSYQGGPLFRYHLTSAFRYFNKWGWFFDRHRRHINKKNIV